jgi:superfamily II DNA or RNA helicase
MSAYIGYKGYSEVKYEKFFIKNKRMFNYLIKNIIFPALKEKYLDIKTDNEKCLIIVGYKLFGKELILRLKKMFSDELINYSIGEYFHEHTKHERDKLDIIISTIQSSGVGDDIPNLRTILLISNFNAKNRQYQVIGRLRRLKNGNIPEFLYFVNSTIKHHLYYRWNRMNIFKKISRTFTTKKIY